MRRHHAGLLAAGVTGRDRERCWRDYRYADDHGVTEMLDLF